MKSLLSLLLVLPLLPPPGMCLCHVFEPAAATDTDDPARRVPCEDHHDHDGCPMCKAARGLWTPKPEGPSSLLGVASAELTPALEHASPTAAPTPPLTVASASPLYLKLRTLRI
jgi:hypothetical protein